MPTTFSMKRFMLFIAILFICLNLAAQPKESWYDAFWKPCDASRASYYSLVNKTDSGWLREDYFIGTKKLQMKALFEDSACKSKHGWAAWFYGNGQLSMYGQLKHNKQEGVYVQYHPNGMMADSGFYREGKLIGYGLGWHSNGMIADSTVVINDSINLQYHWFDNGAMSAGGYLLRDTLYQKWKYYNPFGALTAVVNYNKGKIIGKEYYNTDGTPLADTADTEASFTKGGASGWRNYLGRAATWPPRLRLVNTSKVTLVVHFYINEEGKLMEPRIENPVHPELDRVALDAFKGSPKWVPARQFNRNVKQLFRQPLTFVQGE